MTRLSEMAGRYARNEMSEEDVADYVMELEARVRELEAAVREYLQAEGSSGDLGIRDDRYVVRQHLLAAVSAEKEADSERHAVPLGPVG